MIKVYIAQYSDILSAKEAILACYSKEKGETYGIEYLPSGEPQLVSEKLPKGYVSISHTDGLLTMAFSNDKVGIDVERADRYISPKVCQSIAQWTRIEAYAKWMGKGLSKDIIYGEIPQEIISTRAWGEYVISICSHSRDIEIVEM